MPKQPEQPVSREHGVCAGLHHGNSVFFVVQSQLESREEKTLGERQVKKMKIKIIMWKALCAC